MSPAQKRLRLYLSLAALLVVGLLIGFWRGSTSEPTPAPSVSVRPPSYKTTTTDLKSAKTSRDAPSTSNDADAEKEGALSHQRSIRFSSAEAMRAFRERIKGSGVFILDSIDALNTLRIGFLNLSELDSLLDGTEETGLIYPSYIPSAGSVQPGAVAFGNQFLPWLGAPENRSLWGQGFTVAVLDTGIVANDSIAANIKAFAVIPFPDDLGMLNSHGTAVANLIAGKDGVAPGTSTILDFRIADDNGISDTFKIAKAIVEAVDQGADIINISSGSDRGSGLLSDAVNYADENNVTIVASAGNKGTNYVSYPAAYDTVISVNAVDGRSELLDFSDTGKIDVSAPGYGLAVPDASGKPVLFSGTSASAPITTGTIIGTGSEENTSISKATQLVLESANEAGSPGKDELFGNGIVNIEQITDRNTPGRHDLAVASQNLIYDANGAAHVEVVLENRGTETIHNAPLTVQTPGGSYTRNVSSLAPKQVQAYTFPLGVYGNSNNNPEVHSSISLPNGLNDISPHDNARSKQFNVPGK